MTRKLVFAAATVVFFAGMYSAPLILTGVRPEADRLVWNVNFTLLQLR